MKGFQISMMVEGVRQTVKNFYAENPFTAKKGHTWEKLHLAERYFAKITEKFPTAVIEEVEVEEKKAKAPKAEKVAKEKKIKIKTETPAETDMSDFDEILWEKHGFNEKCMGCLRTCKQHAACTIISCKDFKKAI